MDKHLTSLNSLLILLSLLMTHTLAASPVPISQSILLQTTPQSWTSQTYAISSDSAFKHHGYTFRTQYQSQTAQGDILAYQLNYQNQTPAIQLVWQASQTLSQQSQRHIFSYNPATLSGIDFNWTQLSPDQQQLLHQSAQTLTPLTASNNIDAGQQLLNYIAGLQPSCNPPDCLILRDRAQLLGDIVHSQLRYVAAPDPNQYADKSYQQFAQKAQHRPAMLLVGANDGMLHGFNAHTGEELFAYVPATVLPHLAEYAAPHYQHRYFVDGQITVMDIQLKGEWRTIAIFGLGAGGNSFTAIDITDPEHISHDDILWEFQHPLLGLSYGAPLMGQLQNQQWVMISGNGYNSTQEGAALLVIDIEQGTLINAVQAKAPLAAPATSLQSCSTATLPDTANTPISNALSAASAISLSDTPHRMDFVYAGDLYGNIWRFDLTASLPSLWDASLLYQAEIPLQQPITQAPVILKSPWAIAPYQILSATGKLLHETDLLQDNQGSQTVLGLYEHPTQQPLYTAQQLPTQNILRTQQPKSWQHSLPSPQHIAPFPLQWSEAYQWLTIPMLKVSTQCQITQNLQIEILPLHTAIQASANSWEAQLNASNTPLETLIQPFGISEHISLKLSAKKPSYTMQQQQYHRPQFSWRTLD